MGKLRCLLLLLEQQVLKVRVIALLLKLLPTLLAPFPALTVPLLLAAGIGSVTAGRVGALSEPLLKRFFVFSSRGHVGFRLVGVSLGTAAGATAAVHYAVYLCVFCPSRVVPSTKR
jgi:NADH:ubiquinone oxidoreductase subunit 2 (subunit N)